MRWSPKGLDPANDLRPLGGRLTLWLTGAVLVAALLFGGASRDNLLQVSALELLSLPLLAAAIWRLTLHRGWRSAAAPAAILAAAAAIPLLQLIPLPFELWESLPGRGPAAEALRQAGLGAGWRPISLAPLETWRHALALLPPAAVFLAVASLRDADRRWLTLIVPAGALISLLIGVVQIAGGPDSAFYFYEVTNRGSAVGLFSNRNHQAALLVASLPFAVLWLGAVRDRRMGLIVAAAVLSLVLIEIVGLVVVRSRAGVLLLIPALAACLAMAWRLRAERRARPEVLALGGLMAAALAAGIAFGAGPVLERFADPQDSRLTTAPIVAKAAWDNLPFGAGVGSFPQVYAGVEPVEVMNQTYFNHAHNDYLEIWLDAGWPGAAVLLVFLAWWGSRALAAWRGGTDWSARLGPAGCVAAGLLLIHSAADYPLRTLSLACVFALACGLMTPRPGARRGPVSAAR